MTVTAADMVDKAIQVPTDREVLTPDETSSLRNWYAKASEIKVGDRYRSLGRGSIQRRVESVKEICNCQATARSINSETREPEHFPVIIVTGGNLLSHFRPGSTVTMTNGTV